MTAPESPIGAVRRHEPNQRWVPAFPRDVPVREKDYENRPAVQAAPDPGSQ